MQCLILVFRYYTYHDKRTMNYYSTNKEETISFLRLCLKKKPIETNILSKAENLRLTLGNRKRVFVSTTSCSGFTKKSLLII